MFWLIKVLIGRSAIGLDKPFSYAAQISENPKPLTRVLVDFGHSKDLVGFIAEQPQKVEGSIEEYKAKTGIRLSYVKGFLDKAPVITPDLDRLAKAMAAHYFCPLIAIYQAMLPPSLKPKNSSLGKPKAHYVRMARATDRQEEDLNANERKVLARIKAEKDGLRLSSALIKTKAYQSLLTKGAIAESQRRIDRIKDIQPIEFSSALTKDQEGALEKIEEDPHKVMLFEGVTGSGKTMVYLELARRLLREGKGSIVLVPEIALTNRVAALFKGVFGNRCSILHSALTDSSKYDEYLRIRDGESLIVIGTRSAIFAPVINLGMIVLDEEQSSSYKQDTTPFYDARTVASMRADIEGPKVILASATPLIEDRAKAERDVFGKVTLNHKFASTPKVNASFVDMSDLANISRSSTMLSNPLIAALKETFSNKQQAMLFINRRGFAPIVQCRKCHKTILCPNCGIPLSYHSKEGVLNCHRCEYRQPMARLVCPHCKGTDFYRLGYGTERIESELKGMFPNVKVARLDRDTSIRETERAKIIEGFYKGEFDCLIGTEMIAKGHDFPKVTLAAALSADQSLAMPSYMSGENTFDLVSQLIGRSGRADLRGKAIIQTYDPLNKVLIYASRQDYEGFYRYEMANRQAYLYPPYCYLCDLLVSGFDKKKVLDVVYALKTYLVAKLKGKRVNIYGPSDPIAGIINRKYFKKIMLKYKDPADIKEALEGIRPVFLNESRGVEITIDVDPRSD